MRKARSASSARTADSAKTHSGRCSASSSPERAAATDGRSTEPALRHSCGWFDEFHQDTVGVGSEHEPSERTLNRSRAGADKPVSLTSSALEQRVESHHLELK